MILLYIFYIYICLARLVYCMDTSSTTHMNEPICLSHLFIHIHHIWQYSTIYLSASHIHRNDLLLLFDTSGLAIGLEMSLPKAALDFRGQFAQLSEDKPAKVDFVKLVQYYTILADAVTALASDLTKHSEPALAKLVDDVVAMKPELSKTVTDKLAKAVETSPNLFCDLPEEVTNHLEDSVLQLIHAAQVVKVPNHGMLLSVSTIIYFQE
jgi:hypothetical protein